MSQAFWVLLKCCFHVLTPVQVHAVRDPGNPKESQEVAAPRDQTSHEIHLLRMLGSKKWRKLVAFFPWKLGNKYQENETQLHMFGETTISHVIQYIYTYDFTEIIYIYIYT